MAQRKNGPGKAKPVKSKEVEFDYIKSPYFRAIHADGIFGGITPRGYIHMAIWNQRYAIPQRIVQTVDEKGTLGEEVRREGRDSIIREIDVDVVLDLDVAKSLVVWLIDKIDHAENTSRASIVREDERDDRPAKGQ